MRLPSLLYSVLALLLSGPRLPRSNRCHFSETAIALMQCHHRRLFKANSWRFRRV
jgi:hypothetical protein